jgi:hypothetical protein
MQYSIVDTGFTVASPVITPRCAFPFLLAVISTYESRMLPVEPNIIPAILHYHDIHDKRCNINSLITHIVATMDNEPEYKKYKCELDRYRMLI